MYGHMYMYKHIYIYVYGHLYLYTHTYTYVTYDEKKLPQREKTSVKDFRFTLGIQGGPVDASALKIHDVLFSPYCLITDYRLKVQSLRNVLSTSMTETLAPQQNPEQKYRNALQQREN